jgi:hypothetical protein
MGKKRADLLGWAIETARGDADVTLPVEKSETLCEGPGRWIVIKSQPKRRQPEFSAEIPQYLLQLSPPWKRPLRRDGKPVPERSAADEELAGRGEEEAHSAHRGEQPERSHEERQDTVSRRETERRRHNAQREIHEVKLAALKEGSHALSRTKHQIEEADENQPGEQNPGKKKDDLEGPG